MLDNPFDDEIYRKSRNWTANTPRYSGDQLFSLLANRHRRTLLRQLREMDATNLNELVDVLIEAESVHEEAYGKDRERIAVELHHVHLPKLSQVDVIEYDTQTHQIRYLGDTHLNNVLDQL
jgi:hypothetical protein